MNTDDNMFRVEKSGFEELYSLADAIIATKTLVNKSGDEISTPETLAAEFLQQQIDLARESKLDSLIFTEQEVQFLTSEMS